jgi:hypothetical protein
MADGPAQADLADAAGSDVADSGVVDLGAEDSDGFRRRHQDSGAQAGSAAHRDLAGFHHLRGLDDRLLRHQG